MNKESLIYNREDKLSIVAVLVASVIAVIGLFALIYGNIFQLESSSPYLKVAPAIHATLNALSALSVCLGIAAIIKKKKRLHIALMGLALLFSGVFLVSYIVYHAFHGDTPYLGTGFLRPIYFFILISHVVLSIVALPYILVTVLMALRKRFEIHKKVARVTAPLWLYVSVTGVLVYLFLNAV